MIAFILTHWRTVAAIGAVAVLALLAWRINDLAYERGKADATARQIHIERGLTDEANRALMLTLAAVLPILTACAATTGGVGTEATCAQWRAISWSQHDTAETIGEVKASNARAQGLVRVRWHAWS
ncbi:hypothetical protein ACFFJB_01965 [Camelimonas abortus]|uniref:hypothetical protein n=1 Tax=Camelimonas abortus TaxID=1017184 RepID=UPI0035E8A8DE